MHNCHLAARGASAAIGALLRADTVTQAIARRVPVAMGCGCAIAAGVLLWLPSGVGGRAATCPSGGTTVVVESRVRVLVADRIDSLGKPQPTLFACTRHPDRVLRLANVRFDRVGRHRFPKINPNYVDDTDKSGVPVAWPYVSFILIKRWDDYATRDWFGASGSGVRVVDLRTGKIAYTSQITDGNGDTWADVVNASGHVAWTQLGSRNGQGFFTVWVHRSHGATAVASSGTIDPVSLRLGPDGATVQWTDNGTPQTATL